MDLKFPPSNLREAVAWAMRDLVGLVEHNTCDHPLTIHGKPIKELEWFHFAKEVLAQVKACESTELLDGSHCAKQINVIAVDCSTRIPEASDV